MVLVVFQCALGRHGTVVSFTVYLERSNDPMQENGDDSVFAMDYIFGIFQRRICPGYAFTGGLVATGADGGIFAFAFGQPNSWDRIHPPGWTTAISPSG